jgi:hypothetical protein
MAQAPTTASMCAASIRGPRNQAADAQQNSSISGEAYSSGSVTEQATTTYTTSPTTTRVAIVDVETRRSAARPAPSPSSRVIVTA